MNELFGDRILVEPDKAIEKTESGFLIPDNDKEQPQLGTVILVGSKIDEEIKVGDKVIYAKYSIMEIPVEGKKMFVVDGEDVLGKI